VVRGAFSDPLAELTCAHARPRPRPVHQRAQSLQGPARRTPSFPSLSRVSSLNPTLACAQAKDAHVGAVKPFSTPSAPQPPTLPTDLAAELAAYDAADPVRAAAETPKAAGVAGAGAEEFLQFLEADEPEPEHHH
jgi:F-type H+-transporting ATPase subunit h